MEQKIKTILNSHKGFAGVVIKDSTGYTFSSNEDIIFPSASIIKLFILLALPEEDFNKKILIRKEDKVGGCGVLKVMDNENDIYLTIQDLAYLMICLSDNTATNILIDYLGMDNINKFIQENKFSQTSLQRKMMDSKAKLAGKDNYTSPIDTLHVLESLVTQEKKLNMLHNQASHNKISLYFPKDFPFAHKTGELSFIEHDAGRIFFNDKWVDIVILTKDLETNAEGIKIHNLIGQLIFEKYKD